MSETITDRPGRRLELLEATPQRTVTWTRHAPGQAGTTPHVHREHVDALYVLEGELTLPVGDTALAALGVRVDGVPQLTVDAA